MNDQYLWDGSGEPDPEVRRLELLLSRLRHTEQAADFGLAAGPEPRRARTRSETLRLRFMPRFAVAAAAAAIVLAVTAVWVVDRGSRAAWDVASLEGAPTVGSGRIGESGRLKVGQWLETDGYSRAKINVGTIGEVEVEPNTLIGLLRARASDHRLSLRRGTMHARIWAPPGLFYVETPSAMAVDLGCRYTLSIEESGAGLLEVSHGWVAFEHRGRESFVPAGAFCATRPGIGPGTPYFASASEMLRTALELLDFERLSLEQRADALNVVLAEARREDAITLWHLLSRLFGEQSAAADRVYQRLATLAPPPEGVTREGVLRGERQMLDLWWNSLGLGEVSWWRIWKGPLLPPMR